MCPGGNSTVVLTWNTNGACKLAGGELVLRRRPRLWAGAVLCTYVSARLTLPAAARCAAQRRQRAALLPSRATSANQRACTSAPPTPRAAQWTAACSRSRLTPAPRTSRALPPTPTTPWPRPPGRASTCGRCPLRRATTGSPPRPATTAATVRSWRADRLPGGQQAGGGGGGAGVQQGRACGSPCSRWPGSVYAWRCALAHHLPPCRAQLAVLSHCVPNRGLCPCRSRPPAGLKAQFRVTSGSSGRRVAWPALAAASAAALLALAAL